MTKEEQIIYDVSNKLGISLSDARTLLYTRTSTINSIKRIPKTELMRIKSIANVQLIYAMKSLSSSVISSIKRPILFVESEIDAFKEEIRGDAVALFTPSVNKFLKSATDSQSAIIASSLYKSINTSIDRMFSSIFKKVE